MRDSIYSRRKPPRGKKPTACILPTSYALYRGFTTLYDKVRKGSGGY